MQLSVQSGAIAIVCYTKKYEIIYALGCSDVYINVVIFNFFEMGI